MRHYGRKNGGSRRLLRAVLAVSLFAAVLVSTPIAAAQEGPSASCAGVPATIVGSGASEIFGTPGDDVIVGTKAAETITGGGGDDLICAGGGADTIEGGAGDDIVRGGVGADTIHGGQGDDELYGGRGKDDVRGGRGDDYIEGNRHDDYLSGGLGSDNVRGGKGADEVYGNAGDDTAVGGGGDDYVAGGDGNDTVRGGDGDDDVFPNDGVAQLLSTDENETDDGGPADPETPVSESELDDEPTIEPVPTRAEILLPEPIPGVVCADISFGAPVLTGLADDQLRGSTPATIADGDYRVVLTSADPLHGREDEVDQPQEIWILEGLNAAGEVVFESEPSQDLPFGTSLIETDAGEVTATGVVALRPRHLSLIHI